MELHCRYAVRRREKSPVLSRGCCHGFVPPHLVTRFTAFVETRKCFVFLPFVLTKHRDRGRRVSEKGKDLVLLLLWFLKEASHFLPQKIDFEPR